MSSDFPSTNWARDLSEGLVSRNQLVDKKLMSDQLRNQFDEIENQFHVRIPKIFVEQIQNGDHALAKQFVPTTNELIFFPEDLDDPIGDEILSPVEGITHRYPDRVLLKPTYMCGVYCRFCFRRHKVSHSQYNLKKDAYQKAIEYIDSQKDVWEVILTGGDPLVLTDSALSKIFCDLSAIEQIKVIRIHTRIPSVLPARITEDLIRIFKETNKTIWVAAHMNSALEFTPEAQKALNLLTSSGIPVVLQSVLLKGVNDTQAELVQLLKVAIENKVKPYYLHYPDLARGTQHFRIPLKHAIELVKSLRGKISGMCIPQLIVDIPHGKGKIAVSTHSAAEIAPNIWELESPLTGEKIRITYPKN